MSTDVAYFQDLYKADDPFGYRSRWYEERKRQILLSALPKPRFANVWEFGCSNGELTAALSRRCEALLGTDISAKAIDHARVVTKECSNVTLRVADHPREWPQGEFDLIVFGEVGFYLDERTLRLTARHLGASLSTNGLLVACHWLAPFKEAAFDGRLVHPLIDQEAGLPTVFRYEDADFQLQGWSEQTASVAQLDGIR